MTDLTELPFGAVSEVCPKNRVLDGRAHCHHLANTVEQLCTSALSGSAALGNLVIIHNIIIEWMQMVLTSAAHEVWSATHEELALLTWTPSCPSSATLLSAPSLLAPGYITHRPLRATWQEHRFISPTFAESAAVFILQVWHHNI